MLKMGSTGGGDFENAPPGTHLAVCYGLLDIGTQQVPQKDGTFKSYRKIIFKWELPESLMEDGRPHVVQNRYTLSSYSQGHLRPMIESWLGKKLTDTEAEEFDMRTLLGKACLISLVQNGEYVNVSAVMGAPKEHDGSTINEKQFLSLDPEDYDESILEKQGEKTKQAIMSSPEWQELNAGGLKPTEGNSSVEPGVPTTQSTDMPPTPPVEAYDNEAEDNNPFA